MRSGCGDTVKTIPFCTHVASGILHRVGQWLLIEVLGSDVTLGRWTLNQVNQIANEEVAG